MVQPPPPDPRSDARPERGSLTGPLALIVEGDTILRIEMADLLAEAGFEVLEAWNAQTAILQIERHDAIRLVVADADLTGPEGQFVLTREIAQRWPDLPVLALSSGSPPALGDLPEGARFAQKPLTRALAQEARRLTA